MPVTKKKGAIFAIYADSPSHPTQTASSSHHHQPKSKLMPHSHVSPTKRPSTASSSGSEKSSARRALSVLQPSSVRGPPVTTGGLKAKIPSDSKGGSATKDEKPKSKKLEIYSDTTVSVSRSASTAKKPVPIKISSTSTATKRQLEVFSPAPDRESHPHSGSHSHAELSHTTSNVLPNPPLSAKTRSGGTPAKRNRPSPKKELTESRDGEKENVPPGGDCEDDIGGSPATRTRSKTRSRFQHASISSLSGLGIGGGGSPRRRFERAEREVESLVGDGRGAFTLKKGRALAVFMDSPETEKTRTTISKTESRVVKGLGVRPDGPLVDVSEAYGATGTEPEGFRTAGK